MALPNKFVRFDESILAKISYLLFEGKEEVFLTDLLRSKIKYFDDVGEFLLALDVLYVLGMVDLDSEEGVVKYVD